MEPKPGKLKKEDLEKALDSVVNTNVPESTSYSRYQEALKRYEERGGERPADPDAWKHPDPKPRSSGDNDGWG